MYKILAKDVFIEGLGFSSAYVVTLKYAKQGHTHDFYEIFLVTEGRMLHIINRTKQLLTKGSIVFVRPEDMHSFEYFDESECKFINIAFSEDLFNRLFEFLGRSVDQNRFIQPKLSPVDMLDSFIFDRLAKKFEDYISVRQEDIHLIDLKGKTLLFDILTNCFQKKLNHSMPGWLAELCNQLKQTENLFQGVKYIINHCDKSYEHVCRSFKRYLDTTPGDYILMLRINHAANMLVSTDMPILDIVYEVGIFSLSYFYREFKNKFQTTPLKYRNRYAVNII